MKGRTWIQQTSIRRATPEWHRQRSSSDR